MRAARAAAHAQLAYYREMKGTEMKTDMTQEEAYNVVLTLEDRAQELLDSAKKIAEQFDLPISHNQITLSPTKVSFQNGKEYLVVA